MYRHVVAVAALIALLVIVSAAVPGGASAPASGWAWDSVTKILRNADAASLPPGSFDQDYAQAASVQPASDSSGQHMQALMQNGFAERHYVAGSKERTDSVSEQTAIIVDCAARTITTLDLRKKTYRVVSMDQQSAPSSGNSNGAPAPRATDDGTRVAITISNTTLGAREVSGQPTNGFSSEMSFRETKPSGESQSYNGDLVGYYTQMAEPAPDCSSRTAESNGPSGPSGARAYSEMTAGYARFMDALSRAGLDSRFTVKQTGPALPRSDFAMYEAATIGGGPGGGATFVTERGNVRSIAASDPIFSIPSDFTPAPASP